MTSEEALILRYFAAFNGHDLEAVMACFHDHPVVVDMDDRCIEGRYRGGGSRWGIAPVRQRRQLH
jgi:hypothetical protein